MPHSSTFDIKQKRGDYHPNGGITTFAYDVANRKTSVTNPLGQATSFLAYDGDNRLTRAKGINGVITDMTYHPRGWPLTRTVRANADGSPSSGDAITTMGYDAMGDLTSVQQPDGVMSVFVYDAAHRLTDIGDAMGNSIDYTLDPVGNRIAEHTHDSNNTLTRSLSRTFDARNEVLTQTDGEGHTTTFGYDANGNRTDQTDPLGVQSHWRYDPQNRLESTIRNYLGTDIATNNTTTSYGYDAANHLLMVIDPDELATGYQVDAMGRVTKLISPDTGVTTYTYDTAGNRTSQTDARGITSTYTYDALNRLTSISYPTSSLDVHYAYDLPATGCGGNFPVGHLTRMTDSSGNTAWCYDNRGNVTSRRQTIAGQAYTTTYTNNLANQLLGIGYPDGSSASYTRDADGRIASVGFQPAVGAGSTVVSAIDYLPFGPASHYTFGNGQTLVKTHDYDYRSTGVVSDPLYLQYTLDAAGNPIALKNAPNQTSPVESYHYDSLNRLKQVDDATGAPWQSYTIDRTGDRMTKTTAGIGTDIYQYQSRTHRLIDITGADPSPRAVDANGNTTGIQTAQWTYGFGYDDRNRLALVQQNNVTIAQYLLNGRGERVRKVPAQGYAIDYIHDEAGHLLAEYSASAGAGLDYLWADAVPVAVMYQNAAGRTLQAGYIFTDGLGTPRRITDTTTSQVRWTWPAQKNPFGERAASGPDILNLRFPGQYSDREDGLHYNMFRDYEPGTGRYIESDPIGLKGGADTYAYVENSPLNRTDFYGLYDCGPEASVAKYFIPDAFFLGVIPQYVSFQAACQWHDDCYDDCSKSKGYCDNGFRVRTFEECARHTFGLAFFDCLGYASTYYEAVVLRGQPEYDAAHRKCKNCVR